MAVVACDAYGIAVVVSDGCNIVVVIKRYGMMSCIRDEVVMCECSLSVRSARYACDSSKLQTESAVFKYHNGDRLSNAKSHSMCNKAVCMLAQLQRIKSGDLF
jgi:hypothetical protein